jgi:hypothetical protein
MKKEIFFAIIAGGAFGLIIAFGAWKLNSSLKLKKSATAISTNTNGEPAPVPTENTSGFKVVLVKPKALSVFNDTPTAISGITKPNSYVVISGEDGNTIVNADQTGNFTGNANLVGGPNQLIVSAFDKDGNEADTNLLVVYSSQYQNPNASDSAQIKVPQAYIGTVTDISNSIIQIKDETGNIEQIRGADNADYIDTRNSVTKTIKSTDIAIGDYLIALGVKNTDSILNSSRILVTDPITKPTRRAFFGTVTDDSGYNKFVMKNDKSGETVTITPGTGLQITGHDTFGQIVNGDKLIAVGEFKDGTITARTIEVVK